MQREINIRLNANRAKAVHTGHKFASGDKGIVFKIAVDELDTTGTTARIVFRRSNGTSVEAEVTVTDGICSYTTLGNEFAVVGPVTADVKFYEGEKRISTCTFVFDVASDTLDGIGAGTGGYSDTLEQMKKSMEQTQREMLAVKNDLESRAEEILQQMQKTAEEAEGDVEAAEKKMADLTADLEALYQEYVEAFGSTGPFNPRGPYSETESYTVRDLVSYNDSSWICYRNCTGATPSKESDCWQYFAAGTSEGLQDIIDGTTQVGNAKTLDGHGAEYFQTVGGETLGTSILEKALSYTKDGIYNYCLLGGSYTGTDLPNNDYKNGQATVITRVAAGNKYGTTVILWGANNSSYVQRIAVNYYASSGWTGWREMFTTDGGTINGDVTVGADGDVNRIYTLKNGTKEIRIAVYAGGAFRIKDMTNNKEIILNTADGTNTFNGTSSGNLPLTANTQQIMKVANKYAFQLNNSIADATEVYLAMTGAKTLGFFGCYGENKPVFRDSKGINHDLLHTGNKPTGTYTGNGSATERTINIGGLVNNANLLYVYCSENGTCALVGGAGAICWKYNGGTVEALPMANAQFTYNGILKTATESVYLNETGKTYTWRVL